MKERTALVVGATGLVGKQLVEILDNSNNYKSVTVLVRRPITSKYKKVNVVVIDFNQMENYKDLFQVNDVFCCLGTTIKKAKTKEAFKKVDHEYPTELAKIAKASKVEKFFVISAMGANKQSKFFYNSVKGEMEDSIKAIQLNSLHIFRPSLLLGEREEFRFGEKIGEKLTKLFNPFLIGPLQSYRAITGRKVAQGMVRAAITGPDYGVYVYSSKKIEEMSG